MEHNTNIGYIVIVINNNSILNSLYFERFSTTVGAVEDMDEKIANDLLSTYRDDLGKISDDLVASSISGKVEIGKENKTASVALYARYLKRIGAHLKNITTAITNPFESIGYNE